MPKEKLRVKAKHETKTKRQKMQQEFKKWKKYVGSKLAKYLIY